MRYTTRTGRKLSDQQALADFGKGVSNVVKRYDPLFLGSLLSLAGFLISCYAYLTRSILRVNLGERTFGYLSVLVSFLATWFFISFRSIYSVIEANSSSVGQWDNSFIVHSIYFLETFAAFFSPSTFNIQLSNHYTEISLTIIIAALYAGLMTDGHKKDLKNRKRDKELMHSLYRGDSILFGRLEGRIWNGDKITKSDIWRWIEPIFLLVIAFFIQICLPDYNDLSILIKISAVCLFIEEYKFYKENRDFELNMLDQQLDGMYIRGLQDSYKEQLEAKANDAKKVAYRAKIGKGVSGIDSESQGSNFPFRAKVR